MQHLGHARACRLPGTGVMASRANNSNKAISSGLNHILVVCKMLVHFNEAATSVTSMVATGVYEWNDNQCD